MGPFLLIEPRALRSQGDGRLLALEVIRAIRDAGRKCCSAHPQDRKQQQRLRCGALLGALYKLMAEGTPQAAAGLGCVLTDLLGTALDGTAIPEQYAERESKSLIMRWHGELPKGKDLLAESKPRSKPKTNEIDWAALNPGRKFRERQEPSPEGEDAPESTGPGKARSPAPYPHK